MDKKEFIIAACKYLEDNLNLGKGYRLHTVEFIQFDFYDHHNYCYVLDYRIGVDRKTIFKEAVTYTRIEDKLEFEKYLLQKILNNVFMSGVMSAKKILDEIKVNIL